MFLVSLATFWPSRDAAFVWDDQPYNLAGNSAVMRGDYAFFWKHPYRDFYIPVTYIEQAELHGYQLPAGFADAVRRRIAVKAQ